MYSPIFFLVDTATGSVRLKCVGNAQTGCSESFTTSMDFDNLFMMFEHLYRCHRPIFDYLYQDFGKWYNEQVVSIFAVLDLSFFHSIRVLIWDVSDFQWTRQIDCRDHFFGNRSFPLTPIYSRTIFLWADIDVEILSIIFRAVDREWKTFLNCFAYSDCNQCVFRSFAIKPRCTNLKINLKYRLINLGNT